MEKLIPIGKFAKMIGVHSQTLRRVHERGDLIPTYISKDGYRYYSTAQLQDFSLKNVYAREKITVGYCRVSSAHQKDDLERQKENVKSYMIARGYHYEIITDIGSGINYEKKGLQRLIEKINNREIDKVVVLYKDRLVRFGFELIKLFCELNGVTIGVIDQTEVSKEQELSDDLIQIVTVFASRMYGARSKRTKQLISGVRENVNFKEDTINTNS